MIEVGLSKRREAGLLALAGRQGRQAASTLALWFRLGREVGRTLGPPRGLGARFGRVLSLGLIVLSSACSDAAPPPATGMTLGGTLGGLDTTGYARALGPVDFAFPRDHGPHEAFRTEWWYATGHLDAADGRRFGYQFTLFRSALAPEPAEPTDPTVSASAWSTRQAYMGHFALTDIDGGRFFARERFARGAAGLAGADTSPLRVWLETWAVEGNDEDGVFPLRLVAEEDGVGIDLRLEEGKGIFLNGNRGFSPKGSGEGNASFYYTLPRMPTVGSLVIDGDTVPVTGSSWLDREWSTSVLSEGQVGWDWFAVQLDDGRELMVYRIRRDDGTADPASEGILYGAAGEPGRRLAWGDEVVVEETGRWSSDDGGATYPAGWRIRIPAEGLELTIAPVLADQELRLTFRYWEGAVSVEGNGPSGALTGRGYVELTGYDDARGSGAGAFGRTAR